MTTSMTTTTTTRNEGVTFALFDLDGCLYPIENGWEMQIHSFIHSSLFVRGVRQSIVVVVVVVVVVVA